jgi:hypothetical protein
LKKKKEKKHHDSYGSDTKFIYNIIVLPLTAVEIKRTKNNLAISCSSIVKIVDILFLIASKYGYK